MKPYNEMSDKMKRLTDQKISREQKIYKEMAETIMAEYDSLPKWQRDRMKKGI